MLLVIHSGDKCKLGREIVQCKMFNISFNSVYMLAFYQLMRSGPLLKLFQYRLTNRNFKV